MSDVFVALLAGLGIAILGRRVLLSVQVQTELPVPHWLFPFLIPLLATTGIFVASRLQRHAPVILEIAKFGLMGALSATIDLAVLNFLMQTTGIFRGGLFPLLKGTSAVITAIIAFVWNRNWTFRKPRMPGSQPSLRQFSLYATAATAGLALNVAIATLFVNLLPLPAGWQPIQWANLAALCALASTAAWNFLCYKFIVFRSHDQAHIVDR